MLWIPKKLQIDVNYFTPESEFFWITLAACQKWFKLLIDIHMSHMETLFGLLDVICSNQLMLKEFFYQ